MARISKFGPLIVALLAVMACSLFQPGTPQPYVAPTTAAQGGIPETAAPTMDNAIPDSGGIRVSFPGGSLMIPTGLAGAAIVEEVPGVQPDESQPWWNVAPAHVRIMLQGYVLQGKFHDPQIVIYPANEYAANNESVAANLEELRQAIANPASIMGPQALPGIPFFNAGALIAAQTAVVDFSSGQGIRTLTEYAQFYAQIHNGGLFYQFQGLSADGDTYIVAILPVTAPLLAPESAEGSAPPAGGIPFPGYENMDEAVMATYYRSVTDLLNATPVDQFQPSLASLDALIGSLEVTE